jgi:hypothetical protein
MQIACQRYGCQKAVEVCYWSCKYRRNCQDWKGALEGEPGSEAIRERLEEAAARYGRVFDLATLVKPARANRPASTPPPAPPATTPASGQRPSARAPNRRQSGVIRTTTPRKVTQKMAKKSTEEAPAAAQPEAQTSPQTSRPQKRARRAKPSSNGVVYLLLEKNGRYRELREADLIGEAAKMLKEPSLRLVKGQLLVPQISLRPAGE